MWSCFVWGFSSRMSWGDFALKRYLISLTTLVVVSMSPKFSILTSLPISVEWRASKGGVFFGRSSGYCSENFFAKSGLYTSPMHPIVASQRSSWRLKIFWATKATGSSHKSPSAGRLFGESLTFVFLVVALWVLK